MSAPYKYDIVGSFLRDKEIKQAREDFSLGKINQSQLEEIENKSIGYNGEVRAIEWRTEWVIDTEIPIFKGEGREYIDKLIYVGED